MFFCRAISHCEVDIHDEIFHVYGLFLVDIVPQTKAFFFRSIFRSRSSASCTDMYSFRFISNRHGGFLDAGMPYDFPESQSPGVEVPQSQNIIFQLLS